MIDIVTVAFRDELPVLRAQAQSINLYATGIGVRSIYVIVNDEPYVAGMISTDWWGSLRDRVRIIHKDAFSCSFDPNGWLSQQLLKILASAMSNNAWSMVLDAKTILVRPLVLDKIMQDNKMQVGSLDVYPVFEQSKNITENLFDIVVKYQLGPGGVPFFFHNATVREMIVDVERITGKSFPLWFQAQGMLTEFILYSGYLYCRDHGFDKLYGPNNIGTVTNICHSEVGIYDSKSQQFPMSTTVSIHRAAWSALSNQQQQSYRDFLHSRGITL